MTDLWSEAERLMALNEERVGQMRRAGVQLAENEAEYRVALADAILQERSRGTAATLTGDIVRGRRDIAELKLRRDSAETNYKAFAEEINVNKLRLRVINEQIAREWSQVREGGYN